MVNEEKKSRLYFIYLRYCDNDMKSYEVVSIEQLENLIAELKKIKEGDHDSENRD